MAMMQYSKSALSFTEQFEQLRLAAYQDSAGVWTVGYGHTHDVGPTTTCTVDEAVEWLYEDVAGAVAAVNTLVTVTLSQDEFDALVDFVFNVGAGAFRSSTLLRCLNAGNYADAALQFERWGWSGGKQLAGLLRRRLAEEKLFDTPDADASA